MRFAVVPGVGVTQVGLARRVGKAPVKTEAVMSAFLEKISGIFDFRDREPSGVRAGMIPCGGVVRPVAAQRVLVMTDRQNAVGNRKRVAGQDEMHAVVLLGARDVNGRDARVRQRRAQQAAVHGPRQHHVVGESRLASDLGAPVDAAPRLPDDVARSDHRDASVTAWCWRAAAASTASTICQ